MSITVAKLELYKLIRHPMCATLLTISFFVLSLLFYRLCIDYLRLAQNALQQSSVHASLSTDVIKPLCSWAIIILAIILPLFTVTALSQEYRQQSFILFATSPLKASAIVLGKFLSILTMVLVLVLYILLLITPFIFEASLNWPMIICSLCNVLIIASSLISFGLFISSINSHPVVAMGMTYLGNCCWMLIAWLDPFPKSISFLAKELSLFSHSYRLLQGIIYSPDLVFYCLFNLFWLGLTIQVINHKMKNI